MLCLVKMLWPPFCEHAYIDCVVPKRHFNFLQEMQKRDFKCLSFLSRFAKIINNSTPDYQCIGSRVFKI